MTKFELDYLFDKMRELRNLSIDIKRKVIFGGFYKTFSKEINSDFILKSLEESIENCDDYKLEGIIFLNCLFKPDDVDRILISYNFLVDKNWHLSNSDIADFLQGYKSETSIVPLSNVIKFQAQDPFYFRIGQDGYCLLSRRCLWALHDIGTKKALKIINEALNYENEDIRSYAQEVLQTI